MAKIGMNKDGTEKSLLKREIATVAHCALYIERLPAESQLRVLDQLTRSSKDAAARSARDAVVAAQVALGAHVNALAAASSGNVGATNAGATTAETSEHDL